MGSGEKKQLEIPVIDFSSLDPENSTTPEWAATRKAVVEALEAYGCFEAVYDRVGPELLEELFGRALPELFALPLEVKKMNPFPENPLGGYVGQIPGVAYESVVLRGPSTLEGVQKFTSLMWPQGNPSFCKTALTYGKHLRDLAQMAQRMVLQDLGLEKYSDLYHEPETCQLRLSEYGASITEETTELLPSHKDASIFTIICPNQVQGLEVQTKDGEWIRAAPLPNSFTFMIGEMFTAWTNGRFQAAWHRVSLKGDAKRYSALYMTQPRYDSMVYPMEELADSSHPLLFKPFNYKDYITFRLNEGSKSSEALKDFCGVGIEGKACQL